MICDLFRRALIAALIVCVPIQPCFGDEPPFGGWKTVSTVDIHPGPIGSDPRYLGQTELSLYFAPMESGSRTIWRTDGTVTGTSRVSFAQPFFDSTRVPNSTVFRGEVYFAGTDGVSGVELWKISPGGDLVALVLDIFQGYSSSNPDGSSYPGHFNVFNNELYFTADVFNAGRQLWKTDGTINGTVQVTSIGLLSGPGSPQLYIWDIWEMVRNDESNLLFLIASDPFVGAELWKSDGTDAGTVMVKNINPGSAYAFTPPFSGGTKLSSDPSGPFYFRATDGEHDFEPWTSDGTEQGTMMIEDINLNGNSKASEFTSINSGFHTFFIAERGDLAFRMFQTSRFSIGAYEIYLNPAPMFGSSIRQLVPFENSLYFVYSLVGGQSEVWFTDGLLGEGLQVTNLNPNGMAKPQGLSLHDGQLYFLAHGETSGQELWKCDGFVTTRLTDQTAVHWGALDEKNSLYRVGRNLVFFGPFVSFTHHREVGIIHDVFPPTCGDGIVEAPEECDDGNTFDGDGCQSYCLLTRCSMEALICPDGSTVGRNPYNHCSFDPCPSFCGDGICQSSEQCSICNTDCGSCGGSYTGPLDHSTIRGNKLRLWAR